MNQSVLSHTLKTLDGKDRPLSDFTGQVLLLCNVASRCGLTPQYEGLERLHERYEARGFQVLGFPANNFAGQEPGTDGEIQTFCSTRYGVTFPMFSKISVKGDDQHPLYRYLTRESPFPGEIEWNFGKFLVGRDGQVIARFSPRTDPEAAEVTEAIEAALGATPTA